MITVVTPAESYSLISEAAARAALDVGQRESELVDAMVKRASDVIARYCRRVFAKETITEQFRLDQCQAELILSRYPVVEITSVVESGATLDPSDYEVNKANGCVTRLHRDRPCFWSPAKVVITYASGYELPSKAPGALAQACLQLVKSYYVGADRDPMMRSETVDQLSGASYFEADMPPEVRGLLVQFRNVRAR